MAYEVIILGHLHMPLHFLETFTEYPYVKQQKRLQHITLQTLLLYIIIRSYP